MLPTLFRLTDEQSRAFADAVRSAGSAGADAIAAIYADFERDRERVKPRCDASGACCRFEAYGHRLFITTIEMAAFARSVAVASDPAWDGLGCPYQSAAGRCTAHAARPFGCRVYFCDGTDDWQQSQYERMHERLKSLHESHGVPYFYVEWRDALRACGLAASVDRPTRLTVLR